MNTKDLEQLADKLQSDYSEQANEADENQSAEDKATRFVDYCLSLIASDKVSPEEKKGILYLLVVSFLSTFKNEWIHESTSSL